MDKENSEKEKIAVCKSHYDFLVGKYPSQKGLIEKKIESLCKYFNKKPFQGREKVIWIEELKENMVLTNTSFNEGEEQIPEEMINLLKDKDLFRKITINEMDKTIVREIPTRKAIFLCAQGRLVEEAQIASYNLLVNDEAGAGKDYVTSKVLDLIPSNSYIKKTRISPTVFTYWHNSKYEPEWTWNGKVFYTEDISEKVLNSEVFKVMCSSGSEATIVIKQRAIEIKIEGKPVIITTTATSTPSPELTRRFEIINLDESIDQTKEIMKRHCEYAVKGITPNYNPKFIECQKYLKRVKVKIPFATNLFFLFPAKNIMMRTKFPRFLDLIKASTAFHQFQRKKDEEDYLIADKQDYEIASEVMEKMISNKYLISLTKNQKRILSFFENNSQESLSASKVREKLYNFLSLPAIIENLSLLTSYNILNTHLVEDSRGREIEEYSLNQTIQEEGESVIFPPFEQLNQLNQLN